jgi:hypothetical protein
VEKIKEVVDADGGVLRKDVHGGIFFFIVIDMLPLEKMKKYAGKKGRVCVSVYMCMYAYICVCMWICGQIYITYPT